MREKQQVIRPLNLTGNETVVQSNEFVDLPKELSLQEYKTLLLLISKIDPSSTEIPIIRIEAQEFALAIGVHNSSYIYRDLQRITKDLMKRVILIRESDELDIQLHLIESIRYWKGEGYMDIRISDDMKPYFLHLTREFVKYKLSNVSRLSSMYAIRMYELLKKQELIGHRTFFIGELKKALAIPNSQYAKISHLKERVLDIAQREINRKTDLKIDYTLKKSGRKVVGVYFDISSKSLVTERKKAEYTVQNVRYKRLLSIVQEFGYTKVQAKDFLEAIPVEEAEAAISAAQKRIKTDNVTDPKAMIKVALKERWKDEEAEEDVITLKGKEDKVIRERKTGVLKAIKNFFEKIITITSI